MTTEDRWVPASTHAHTHKKRHWGDLFPLGRGQKDKQMQWKMALSQISIKDESVFLVKVPVFEPEFAPLGDLKSLLIWTPICCTLVLCCVCKQVKLLTMLPCLTLSSHPIIWLALQIRWQSQILCGCVCARVRFVSIWWRRQRRALFNPHTCAVNTAHIIDGLMSCGMKIRSRRGKWF